MKFGEVCVADGLAQVALAMLLPTTIAPFTDKLMKAWATGKMSSAMVQDLAQAAQDQGAKGMAAMSSSGATGAWQQNIQRSLITLFGQPEGPPPVTWVNVPTAKGTQLHPVLLPPP